MMKSVYIVLAIVLVSCTMAKKPDIMEPGTPPELLNIPGMPEPGKPVDAASVVDATKPDKSGGTELGWGARNVKDANAPYNVRRAAASQSLNDISMDYPKADAPDSFPCKSRCAEEEKTPSIERCPGVTSEPLKARPSETGKAPPKACASRREVVTDLPAETKA